MFVSTQSLLAAYHHLMLWPCSSLRLNSLNPSCTANSHFDSFQIVEGNTTSVSQPQICPSCLTQQCFLPGEKATSDKPSIGNETRQSFLEQQEYHSSSGKAEMLDNQESVADGRIDPRFTIERDEDEAVSRSESLAASMLESGLREPLPEWPSQKLVSASSGLSCLKTRLSFTAQPSLDTPIPVLSF